MRQFGGEESVRLQVIDGKRLRRRPDQAVCVNKGIRDSLIRLISNSELHIGSLRKAANLAGTNEGTAFAILRNFIQDAQIDRTPLPPAPARRAA